jgi:hypothetical protein
VPTPVSAVPSSWRTPRGRSRNVKRVKIELLYFDGCPGYEELRPRLERVLAERGLAAELELVSVTEIDDAEARAFLGSPSVRVAGRDVELQARDRTDYGMKCRIYRSGGAVSRAPSDEMLVAALDEAGRDRST